jgi:predicted Zn-dependent peptidase
MNRIIAPELKVLDRVEVIKPEQLILPSGVRAHFIGGCLEDIAQIDLVFDAGSKHQSKALQANLTAAMLLEGSAGRSGVDIMDELDGYGAYVDLGCDYDKMTLSVFTTIRTVQPVLSLIRSILESPNFDQKDFDLLLSNKRQNFLIQSEKVSTLARRRFYEVLFNNHSYGKIASIESYENVSLDDCRSFYENVIKNARLDCFVAGKMTTENIKTIEASLKTFELTSNESSSSFEEIQPNKSVKIHLDKSGVQTGLRIGKKSIRRGHPDYSALQVTTVALGGYFGSRLMKNIREDKGYTYGIGSGLVTLDHAGIFYIATEVGNQYLESTLVEVEKELDLLKQSVMPEEELFLIKNYIGGSVARSLDGAFEQMDKFKTVYYSGLSMDYYNSYLQEMREVTASQVMETAQNYLNRDSFIQITAGEATKS